MAGDLQATIEICVELSTFHNVDLFQRGYYQIRCSLKPPEKAISCVDVEYTRINGDYQPDDCLYPALVTPSGLTAVSKTFQILYKNEEIVLSDSFIFRLNMLVDSNKLTDQIDQADVQLLVELCFSDAEVGPDSPDCLVSVSSQVLKLHLSCIKGLHHHVPVLFDYFHFAVIDTTLHAVLVKLSLPDPSIFKMPKPSWFSKSSTNTRMSTPLFYSKLFGYKPINNILTSRTASEEKQIRFAYDTHRSLCSTLFSVKVNLLAYFDCLSEFLPESQHIQLGLFDFGERLESALESIQSLRSANEVFAQICSDLDSISNEVSLVWSQFLESYTLNRQILPYLRNEHHRQRVGHFSEAFFLQDFSWDDLQVQQEQSFQLHQSLGQGIKNSRYYQTIPAVAVECPGLDGDSSSTPIIFEDKYTVATSQQEADHVDSDLEKVDLVLEDDTVVNNEDIFIIETDSKDVLASKDDPNMPLLLGGVLCDRDGPVRETMILDDDIDDGNSYLIKTLKEIQDLENQYLSDGNASDNQGLDKPNLSEENEGKCSIGDDMSNLNLFDIPNQSDVGCMVESTAEKDSANELEVSKDATSTTDNDTNKNSSIPGNDINNDCEISKEVKSTINAANTESSGVVLNAENSGVVINETSLSPDQPSQEASDDSEVPADQSNEENVVENTVIITQNSVEDITKKDDTDKTKCENKSQDTQSDKDNKNKASEALVKDMASIEETCLDEEEPKQSNPAITSEETQKTERNSSDDILENALKDEPAKGFEDGECLDQTTQDDLSAQVTSENSCNDEKLHQVSTSAEGDENDSSTHEMENPNSYNKSEKDMEKQSILEECNASDEKKPLPDIDNEEAMLPKYSDFEPEEKQITSSSNLVTNCDTPKLDNNDATPILDEKHPSKSDLSQCGSLNTVATGQEEMPSTKSSDSASDITNQTPRTLLLEHPPNPMDNKDGCRKAPQLQHHQQQEKQKEQNTRSQNTSKKTKKKSHQKGMAITGCLPVGCTGNSSPSFSRGNYSYGGSIKSRFELAKRYMKRQLKFSCQIYSDIGVHAPRDSYFSKQRPDSIETHLIVCVHGLDGNSGDLRLFKCYLEMALPSSRFDFLMSEINQGDTFVSFEELTDRLVQEILHYIDAYSLFPSKISFVGHSLGNIIIRSALSHPGLEPLLDKMHTLLSLSGPHLGMLYPTSPLVSTGLWLMQKWKKSEALMQLSLNDHEDLRQTYLFRLSQSKGLEYFKNVLLVSSVQDHYVPYHSARIEMCKAASKDTTEYGSIYRQMVSNLMSPLYGKKDMTLIRYSCYHALNSSANSFIGRAAHIAMLDSELFIEKLLLVSALDYFR